MPQVEITVTGAPRFVGQHAVRAVRREEGAPRGRRGVKKLSAPLGGDR